MINIIADKQTRLYELTYLLPGDLTESERTVVAEKILHLIVKYQGEVLLSQDWERRDLAYKLKHQGKLHQVGVYLHLVVKFLPTQVQAFEKELLLEEDLMRHLLVVSDNQDEQQVVKQKEEEKAME